MNEENNQVQNIPKTPLVGILIAIIGVIIFISSFFAATPEGVKIESTVSYASTLKASTYDPSIKVQSINVIYEYQGKKYETGIRDIENGQYKIYDKVTIYIDEKDPTIISLKTSSKNNTWFVGVLFIVFGGITFIGILDPIIAFIKTFLFGTKEEKKENQQKEQKSKEKINIKEIITDATDSVSNTITKIKDAIFRK